MLRRHTVSFLHAFEGIIHALRTQPNLTIHLLFSGFALLFGWVFQVSRIEWIILTLTISVGLVIEMINTSVESMVDLITKEHHTLAKIAKDTCAGAMLIYALGAVVIAGLIFLPKLWPV